MKTIVLLTFLTSLCFCYAFDCQQWGPSHNYDCAYLGEELQAFGGEGNLYLYEDDLQWHTYSYSGLPVRAIYPLDDDNLLVALGGNSFSDGVYTFNLTTHQFQVQYWYMLPVKLVHCDTDDYIYVCDRDALHRSLDGLQWSYTPGLPSGICTSFTYFGSNYAVDIKQYANYSSLYYSTNAGSSWQLSTFQNITGLHYTSLGVLYGIKNIGGNDDGLYRSDDFGANWTQVLQRNNLSAIGPDFNGCFPLGYSNSDASGLELCTPAGNTFALNDPNLNSVKALEIFPFVNTLSFYALTPTGCYFITSFLPPDNTDEHLSINQVNLKAYPNPVKDRVFIKYDGIASQALSLSIYNVKGQLIRTIDTPNNNSNVENTVVWDMKDTHGKGVGTGIYFIKLQCNNRVLGSKRIIVME